MSNENRVKGGWTIPIFVYDSMRHLLIPEEANRLVQGHNRIHKLEIVRGNADAVFISDEKITIQLKRSAADQEGIPLLYYRGEYSADKNTTHLTGQEFIVGHMVRVSLSNAESTTNGGGTLPGVYVCNLDNPTSANKPRHPLQSGGENAYWNWISTWPYQTEVCDEEGNPTDFLVDGQEVP